MTIIILVVKELIFVLLLNPPKHTFRCIGQPRLVRCANDVLLPPMRCILTWCTFEMSRLISNNICASGFFSGIGKLHRWSWWLMTSSVGISLRLIIKHSIAFDYCWAIDGYRSFKDILLIIYPHICWWNTLADSVNCWSVSKVGTGMWTKISELATIKLLWSSISEVIKVLSELYFWYKRVDIEQDIQEILSTHLLSGFELWAGFEKLPTILDVCLPRTSSLGIVT